MSQRCVGRARRLCPTGCQCKTSLANLHPDVCGCHNDVEGDTRSISKILAEVLSRLRARPEGDMLGPWHCPCTAGGRRYINGHHCAAGLEADESNCYYAVKTVRGKKMYGKSGNVCGYCLKRAMVTSEPTVSPCDANNMRCLFIPKKLNEQDFMPFECPVNVRWRTRNGSAEFVQINV